MRNLRIVVNPLTAVPITSLSFDPFEELLWCGNMNGRVSSFFAGNGYEKYTSFCAADGDIRDIAITENAVFSLSANTLKANTRQGLHINTHTSSNCSNLSELFCVPQTPFLIMGGNQPSIVQYDYEKQKELRAVQIKEKNITGIRSNGNFIFTSDSFGNIAMRSMSSFETLRVLKDVHSGSISDFDVCGNKLITCGCSLRMDKIHGDAFVKVYDLRFFQPQKPLPLSFSPAFARFLPTFYDSRIVSISQMGQAQLSDLNNQPGYPFIVDCEGYVSAFNISTTKQIMAFGDMVGNVHVYADRPNPIVNEHSYETEFADPSLGPPHSFTIDDTQTSLASVPFPFSPDETLLSDWPEELCVPMHRKSKPCGPYASIKNIQFVGYAANPRAATLFRYFNVVPYFLDFEPERPETPEEKGPAVIPQFYRKLRIKPSRVGVGETSTLLAYNKTNIVPLESTSSSVYIDSVVHSLNGIPVFQNLLISHICDHEHCIACQLGFLFRMLCQRKQCSSATSKNLVRSIIAGGGCPELTGDALTSAHNVITYLHTSINSGLLTQEELTILRSVMGFELAVHTRCVRCSTISLKDEDKIYVTLQYPAAVEHMTLCGLIEKAIHARQLAEQQCNSCLTKTSVEENRKIKRLPPVIAVDCNASNPNFVSFWTNQLRLSERRPKYNRPEDECNLAGKTDGPCRYGEFCRNKQFCKYIHLDVAWDAECERWLSTTGGVWKQFVTPTIHAKLSNGITILSDKAVENETEAYELAAMVVAIKTDEDGPWNHTVAIVKNNNNEALPWAIINESLVTEVHTEEALSINSKWKLPLMFIYVNRKNAVIEQGCGKKLVPSHVFHNDTNLTGDDEVARERKTWNIPQKQDVVGIDAEFIDISREGKKSVARVSVVDLNTSNVLIDDYIVTCAGDVVNDYLTPFSGIREDDLNPHKSTKHLTTLKRCYLKILHMVENGVVFVGHGLNNDFSVLNIYVPPEQMIDTVQLFHLPQKRMISLQFLAWYLLGENIQESVHDSVEDARVALNLYKKWKEFEESHTLDNVLTQLYETGEQCNWRTPFKSVSPQSDGSQK
ncbi:unnamed protein product [Auanema sp. JU1783]|nr:unnamed protein product [Auanema sp. JU1783]